MRRDPERELAWLESATADLGEAGAAFVEHARRRLSLGEEAYGDAWAGRTVEQLVDEMVEETLDVGAWGVLALQALELDTTITSMNRTHVATVIHAAVAIAARSHQALTIARRAVDGQGDGMTGADPAPGRRWAPGPVLSDTERRSAPIRAFDPSRESRSARRVAPGASRAMPAGEPLDGGMSSRRRPGRKNPMSATRPSAYDGPAGLVLSPDDVRLLVEALRHHGGDARGAALVDRAQRFLSGQNTSRIVAGGGMLWNSRQRLQRYRRALGCLGDGVATSCIVAGVSAARSLSRIEPRNPGPCSGSGGVSCGAEFGTTAGGGVGARGMGRGRGGWGRGMALGAARRPAASRPAVGRPHQPLALPIRVAALDEPPDRDADRALR
jgi:hypothetical protein